MPLRWPSWISGEWRFLAHLVYRVPKEELGPLLPADLSVDVYDGSAYVAVVAGSCRSLRWRGLPVLSPEGFRRIRWQAYVRRGSERGVFPLSEMYSMAALAKLLSSRSRFGAKGGSLGAEVEFNPGESGSEGKVRYHWGEGAELRLETEGLPVPAEMWPEEQFFVDCRRTFFPRGAAEASRPTQFVWEAKRAVLTRSAAADLAGDKAGWLAGAPAFAYLAKGGTVSFRAG